MAVAFRASCPLPTAAVSGRTTLPPRVPAWPLPPLPRRARRGVGVAVLVGGCIGCAPRAEPPAPPPIETRKTIGKTTQNVLELSRALADGGVRADLRITGDGLEAYADAYRTSVGKIAVLAVEQRMKMHQLEHDSLPETHEEFMAAIIRPGHPGGLQLPMLPYYQEYAYDPAARALVVVEFPAKKQQRERETTGPLGL
jgi:hypothetical protein